MKTFKEWCKLKSQVQLRTMLATFHEREIWWANIGENIGHEEDGKTNHYSRPVLVIRKFNAHIFWGVPLSTQVKDGAYYYKITFKDREQIAMLSQLRVFDAKRLTDKMGKISDPQFEGILQALISTMQKKPL